MRYCHFGVSPVNYSDSNWDSIPQTAKGHYLPVLRKPIGDISLSGLGRDWTLRRNILHLNDI